MMDKNNVQNRRKFLLTIAELILVFYIVYFDVFIPTVVVLFITIISMLIRKEKITVLGFCKTSKMLRMFFEVFALTVVWTLMDFGVFLPILNHLTGTLQNLNTFENLKGNISLLLFLLCASWTLAAFGEEIVYRGFIQTRIKSLCKNNKTGIVLAVLFSSILFSLAHREQGIVGIVITFSDAMYFSFLLYKYKSIWASILAHGLLNTIGIVTFFFTGPLYGLW